MTTFLDRWHQLAVDQPLLRTSTIIVRVLLALAFLPSGWVKVAGHRFTTLPMTDPVGFFFEGFFSAHGYYRLVGAAQLLAAILLLFPWTATLGAVLYFPIILNIFVITVSIGSGFGGTRIVTGLMLLGNVYLLLWDYDRWKGLLPLVGSSPRESAARHGQAVFAFGFLLAAAIGFFGVLRLHLAWLRHLSYVGPSMTIAAGAAIGIATLVRSATARS
jgi:hypothetical protein